MEAEEIQPVFYGESFYEVRLRLELRKSQANLSRDELLRFNSSLKLSGVLLHELQVYCIAKGKDHKTYEDDANPSIVSTAKEGLILSVVSHAEKGYYHKALDKGHL